VASQWAISFKMTQQAEANKGTLTFRTVANAFRDDFRPRAKGANRAGIHKGGFGATYGNTSKDSDLLDSSDEGDAPTEERKDTGRKRRRGDTSGGVCLACGLSGHGIANCYYAFPDKAYKSFKPKKHLQKRTEENLKKDDIKAEFEKLKKEKSKNKKQYKDPKEEDTNE